MAAGSASDDEQWRVVVLPGLESGQATAIKSFTLPDPRGGRPQGFLLANGSLLEVNRFKQSHSAWLVGERLLADGGIFLATVYDPLFVLLPVLDRSRDKDESCPAGKFKELEELLYDESTPGFNELVPYARGDSVTASCKPSADTRIDVEAVEAVETEAAASGIEQSPAADVSRLHVSGLDRAGGREGQQGGSGVVLPTAAPQTAVSSPGHATLHRLDQQLACICDVRRVDDTSYYRLSDDRVVAWLCCKFRRLQAAVSHHVVGMDKPHAAAYTLGILAEFVGDSWVGRVAQRLGINERQLTGSNGRSNTAAGATLQPADENTSRNARPAPLLAGPPEKKQKADVRVVAKHAALAKQAVGTKKLTSFFTKK